MTTRLINAGAATGAVVRFAGLCGGSDLARRLRHPELHVKQQLNGSVIEAGLSGMLWGRLIVRLADSGYRDIHRQIKEEDGK